MRNYTLLLVGFFLITINKSIGHVEYARLTEDTQCSIVLPHAFFAPINKYDNYDKEIMYGLGLSTMGGVIGGAAIGVVTESIALGVLTFGAFPVAYASAIGSIELVKAIRANRKLKSARLVAQAYEFVKKSKENSTPAAGNILRKNYNKTMRKYKRLVRKQKLEKRDITLLEFSQLLVNEDKAGKLCNNRYLYRDSINIRKQIASDLVDQGREAGKDVTQKFSSSQKLTSGALRN